MCKFFVDIKKLVNLILCHIRRSIVQQWSQKIYNFPIVPVQHCSTCFPRKLQTALCMQPTLAGAHHSEPATTPYSCHGVFTDRSIFSLNLSRIQIPAGTSVTNYNHKHGLMLTCSLDIDMFTWGRIVLSSPKRANVDWNWPISQKKNI